MAPFLHVTETKRQLLINATQVAMVEHYPDDDSIILTVLKRDKAKKVVARGEEARVILQTLRELQGD